MRGGGPFLLLLSALLAGAVAAQTAGRCVEAEVPSPVLLPDGATHGPGLIRLCLGQRFSPAAALHETYLDGELAGAFISRLERRERTSTTERPFVRFRRSSLGEWVLDGYGQPFGGHTLVYTLEWPARARGGVRITGPSRVRGGAFEPVILAVSTE